MYWYGLSSLVFWALAVVAVVAVITLVHSIISGDRRPPYPPYRGYGASGPYSQAGPPPGHGPVTPEQILAERFARGEIDEDEFWQRMTTLRAGRADNPSSATAS
jgi:putative membrane protein